MRLADVAQRLPHRAVALEAAAKAELPQAVALAHAARVLDVAQDVPARRHTLPPYTYRPTPHVGPSVDVLVASGSNGTLADMLEC